MHASQIQGCIVEQRVEKKRKIAESVWVHNNNNNNKHDNVYGAVIMADPLREFTRFI